MRNAHPPATAEIQVGPASTDPAVAGGRIMGAISDCDICGTQITCGSDQLLDFVLLTADHWDHTGHHMRVRVVRG